MPWLLNRCFYFCEGTPYESCLCRDGDTVIRCSTDGFSVCFLQVFLRGGLICSSINSSGDNEGMCVIESERLDQDESLVKIHLGRVFCLGKGMWWILCAR